MYKNPITGHKVMDKKQEQVGIFEYFDFFAITFWLLIILSCSFAQMMALVLRTRLIYRVTRFDTIYEL